MKNIFLIFFLIFIVEKSNAQVIYHFPHDSASWGQFSGFVGNGTYGNTTFYSCNGDTMLGNLGYIRIIQTDSTDLISSLFAFIREDSLGKIWARFAYQFSDTNEYLLYDFNASVGDSLNVLRDLYSNITHLVVVDSISTFSLLNSETRRCFYLSSDCGGGLFWIEGIGSNSGLFYPSGVCLFDELDWLTCFHQHDTLKYNSGTVCNLILGTPELNKNFSVKISPNPFTDNFQLSVTDINSDAVINIYNIVGQQIFSSIQKPQSNSIHKTVSLSSYPAGVYIISIKVNGENFIRKVVKE